MAICVGHSVSRFKKELALSLWVRSAIYAILLSKLDTHAVLVEYRKLFNGDVDESIRAD